MPIKREHPEPMLITLLPQIDESKLPQNLEDLQDRMADCYQKAERKLTLFREGLKEFAATWVTETAKIVAVTQNEHTLRLGRRGVRSLKRRIQALNDTLSSRVEQEFTNDYLFTDELSSGQVALVVDRRFVQGIRNLLKDLMPVLNRAGYQRDHHWLDEEGHGTLDLPADLRSLLDEMVEALAEAKVCRAKMKYFDQQSRKQAAQRLWDGA